MSSLADSFLDAQLGVWPLAKRNFDALAGIAVRGCGPEGMRVQFNPARAVSTGARVDAEAIKKRPCFLCAANRPPEQYAGAGIRGYELLVNPFPIFSRHFTIAAPRHTPQVIEGMPGTMASGRS